MFSVPTDVEFSVLAICIETIKHRLIAQRPVPRHLMKGKPKQLLAWIGGNVGAIIAHHGQGRELASVTVSLYGICESAALAVYSSLPSDPATAATIAGNFCSTGWKQITEARENTGNG
jgi:hypothetical protein